MSNAPLLLNDDGTASVATFLLMSHHGLRRDLARFQGALAGPAAGGPPPLPPAAARALEEEWQKYRATLHGHHQAEDTGLFPHLRSEHAELAPALERLTAEHHLIDPLLDRGDRAFAELNRAATAAGRPDASSVAAAVSLLADLSRLLHDHLAFEEERAVPHMRSMKGFPPPATDAELAMFAEGFAWSSHGVAPEVLAQVDAVLPPVLVSKLPAARAAFEERCRRVWGSMKTGASRTAVPDWMASG